MTEAEANSALEEAEAQQMHFEMKQERPNFDLFRNLLLQKHGNMLLAWRIDMDRDGDWRLSFHEFCNAATDIGFFFLIFFITFLSTQFFWYVIENVFEMFVEIVVGMCVVKLA